MPQSVTYVMKSRCPKSCTCTNTSHKKYVQKKMLRNIAIPGDRKMLETLILLKRKYLITMYINFQVAL